MPRVLLAVLAVLIAVHAAAFPALAEENDTLAYIRMAPLTVTQSSEQTVIKVTIVVMAERRAEAEKLKPALAEAFQQQLTEQTRSGANMMQGATLDLWHIKASLLTAAEKSAPAGLIKDIKLDVTQGRT